LTLIPWTTSLVILTPIFIILLIQKCVFEFDTIQPMRRS
jgi:hypothetical protein